MIAYTAIIGDYDTIKDQPLTGAPFMVVRSIPFEGSNRTKARWAKMMAHHLFPKARFSLWIDGSIQLPECRMEHLITEHLAEHDIAVMKHPERSCVYDEGLACIKYSKAEPVLVNSLMQHYDEMGWPTNMGLSENGFMLRRHTEQVNRFCEDWFKHTLEGGTERDQLHFQYVANMHNLSYRMIPERFFKVEKHKQGKSTIFKGLRQ